MQGLSNLAVMNPFCINRNSINVGAVLEWANDTKLHTFVISSYRPTHTVRIYFTPITI